MYLRSLVVTFISSLWFGATLRADDKQSSLPPVPAAAALTLAEAQRLACEHNTDSRIAQIQVEAAMAQFSMAREFPNPTLGLSIAKINTDRRSNATALGNGFFDRSYDSIVSLSQLLEVGKRGPRQDSARAGQRAAEAQRDDVRRLLIKSVSQAYVAVLEATEEALILGNSAASLRREADLATLRLRVGDIAETDKAQIEITAAQRALDAAAARHIASSAMLVLETLLGTPAPAGRIQLSDSLLTLATAHTVTADEVAPDQRPDLTAAEATLAKAESDLVLQHHGVIPDFTVSVLFEHNPPDAPNTVGLGVSLPLPLWNRNGGAIRAARAARAQAQALLEKTSAQISADVADARSAYREAHARSDSYRGDLTAKSANVVHTVAYSYEHGGSSLVELLAAERNDNDIRLASARAQADAVSAAFALSAALNRNGTTSQSVTTP